MRHYKEATKPCKELIKTTCDICGEELHDWVRDGEAEYVDEVIISHHKFSTFFGEPDSNGKLLEPDICGNCFENKIYPFLRSIGLKETYSD